MTASERSQLKVVLEDSTWQRRTDIKKKTKIKMELDKAEHEIEKSARKRVQRCGTQVDGPSCRGCAFLRKKFDEDLLAYCVENGIFKDFQDTSESSNDNTNVVNAFREPSVGRWFFEQQLVDRKIKEITNDLGIRRFRGEEIDEEFERDCEIRIHKLKQDFNVWGSEVRKKEKAYEDEKCLRRRKKFSSKEPDNSLNIGDGHLDTIPATESNEVIKSSVENLVPIPSEFEGISDNTCDVPNCDNNCVNVESDFGESLINRDTSIVYYSKIDPILEEFTDELAHIAPIPPGIVEADFDPNDDTLSDDDDFEDIEYVSLEEKLLKVHRLISNIESLKVNSTPDRVLESPSSFPIPVVDSDSSNTSLSFSNNSLPEFESFSDHTEETRSGSTTTHANYSLPEYESFHFDNPSLPRPPPKPPDIEILKPEINNFDVLYNDESFESGEGENIAVSNVEEDDSFTFTIRTFLPFLT
ncbi:hypothetical protein Tco_0411303 [Tanacetum coccineum]